MIWNYVYKWWIVSNPNSKRRNELKKAKISFKIHVMAKSNHAVDTEMFLSLVNCWSRESIQLMPVLWPMLNDICFWISGRSLSNSVINLGIQDQYTEALSQLGFEFEVLAEQVLFTFNLIFWILQFTLLQYHLRAIEVVIISLMFMCVNSLIRKEMRP